MTDGQSRNLLCYGDNLGFLEDRSLFPDGFVDLIYLDPPFNSQQSYNILFKEAAGTPAAAQIKAFEDTWRWDMAANEALTKIHTDSVVPASLVELTKTFMNFLKPSPMMAYLVQMAVRLVHMHRVLKPTGSLYLHCDPTASHYLKLVLDAIFGPGSFVNEIVWKRTSARSDSHRWNHIHDTILFYAKGERFTWNPQHLAYDEDYVRKFYRQADPGTGRLYQADNLTAAGTRAGSSGDPWHGIDVRSKGLHWKYRIETLEELDRAGRIAWPRKKGGVPRYKRYLDEMPGIAVQSIIGDIPPISAQSAEKMGYPTQKPIALLKRIVAASSNPADTVLDPFCGCGTTIDAVETLNREHPDRPPRRWIGIDITHLAINLIKHRLMRFDPLPEYEVLGEPASLSGAEALAQDDPFQFQYWVLGLVGARPRGGRKKGADQGVDGVRYFVDEMRGKQPSIKAMLVQVKGGKVGVRDVRDLAGTMGREKANLGLLVTLASPTGPMKAEAASAGSYVSPWDGKPWPRMQILTVKQLLDDPYRPNPRCLLVPGGTTEHTLPKAPKHRGKRASQKNLSFDR